MEALKERAKILPMPEPAPICKTQTCRRPLTKLGEPWNCWICLRCHEHPDVVNKKMRLREEPERKYLDVKVTEANIDKIVARKVAEAMAKIQSGGTSLQSEYLHGMNSGDMMNPELAKGCSTTPRI